MSNQGVAGKPFLTKEIVDAAYELDNAAGGPTVVGMWMRAAAREIDRLRRQVAGVNRTCDLAFESRRKVIDEQNRLRAVIRDAPHELTCSWWSPSDDTKADLCTCWKADAL